MARERRAARARLGTVLVYLDQNHACRIAKFLRGQPSHGHFGQLHTALHAADARVPASPFHVLETRGGYLLPTLKELFGTFSGGLWVRPWQEVARRQIRRGGLARDDLLSVHGDWRSPARLDPLDDLLEIPSKGSFLRRRTTLRDVVAGRFGLTPEEARRLPFFELLSRLAAFRSRDEERAARPSDLTDLLMAATVAPYVDALATDRYLAEMLVRVGHDGPVFSGRRNDVLRFAAWLHERAEAR